MLRCQREEVSANVPVVAGGSNWAGGKWGGWKELPERELACAHAWAEREGESRASIKARNIHSSVQRQANPDPVEVGRIYSCFEPTAEGAATGMGAGLPTTATRYSVGRLGLSDVLHGITIIR